MNAEARRAIQKYLEERSDGHPALFISNRQERTSVRSVQHLLGQYGVHPHQLRHTFITGLVRANEDIASSQQIGRTLPLRSQTMRKRFLQTCCHRHHVAPTLHADPCTKTGGSSRCRRSVNFASVSGEP